MWLIVQFDLPVQSGAEVRAYREFRNSLFRLGFSMLQKSVYIRYEESDTSALSTQAAIAKNLPPIGNISLLRIPDISMAKSLFFTDQHLVASPRPPNYLMIC